MGKSYGAMIRFEDGSQYILQDVIEVEYSSSTSVKSTIEEIISKKISLGSIHTIICVDGLFYVPNSKIIQFVHFYSES